MDSASNSRAGFLERFRAAGFVRNIDELNLIPEKEFESLVMMLDSSVNDSAVKEIKRPEAPKEEPVFIPEPTTEQRIQRIIESCKVENGMDVAALLDEGKNAASDFLSYYDAELKPHFVKP